VESILRETADVDFGGRDEFFSQDGFASFSFFNVVRMLSRTDGGRVRLGVVRRLERRSSSRVQDRRRRSSRRRNRGRRRAVFVEGGRRDNAGGRRRKRSGSSDGRVELRAGGDRWKSGVVGRHGGRSQRGAKSSDGWEGREREGEMGLSRREKRWVRGFLPV